jgi:hypothetical protein
MGNDMRNVTEESKAILKNKDAIAISQDPLGQMGIRITGDLPQQVWARELANGDVAVGLYNKGGPARLGYSLRYLEEQGGRIVRKLLHGQGSAFPRHGVSPPLGSVDGTTQRAYVGGDGARIGKLWR